tara:strand:+ start:900 stop:1475 length:576 start_codon:yes stop_codon:yes gene_type:complete
MANWYQDQLTNKNFLSPIGFVFLLEKARKTSFLCQKAEIPSITLGKVDIPTRGMVSIPIEGNVQYGELNIEFIVDEDLRNYMELHNWIRALGVPQGDDVSTEAFKNAHRNPRIPTGQYKGYNDYRYSDATLQVLNNNNLVNFDVVFKDVFPVALSTMPFDVTGTDNDYLTATATFEYVLYEVRETNQQKLR